MSAKEQSLPFYPQEGVAVTCRSFREYAAMFSLDETELREGGPVLDAAAGASSFAAELRARGIEANAADPRYAISPDALYEESLEEIGVSTAKLARLKDRFDWTFYGGIDAHRANREQSLERFIADYRALRERGDESIYVPASLPNLPFSDGTFSLVLCSHFLFLYEEQFDASFHLEAVRELYRVVRPGGELRIYPICNLRFERYSAMPSIIEDAAARGARVETVRSHLPFIPGSSELLRMAKPR
ncbi:methyltransferase domain-containing protein [Paenibacillus alkalitolerans]|uniref:methyltransferase domain-containing protein n=1 Tax=Paenibacillus alkalitolerans TaxID=2799335 RepID=UPI0018F5F244|nr:methyltransferase domain-containing protein [Paenibacillus alkalitolerans]